MRFLLRFVVIFLVISTVFSMLRNLLAPTAPRRPMQQPEAPRKLSTHLVKDPVCGTYVPEDSPIRSHDLVFCSEECRKKYATV